MTGLEWIVPERVVQLANELDNRVGPHLDWAKAYFEQAEIDGEAFSQAGLSMQIAYPGAREWAIADADDSRTELRSITDRLAKTAGGWAQAESDSTVVEI